MLLWAEDILRHVKVSSGDSWLLPSIYLSWPTHELSNRARKVRRQLTYSLPIQVGRSLESFSVMKITLWAHVYSHTQGGTHKDKSTCFTSYNLLLSFFIHSFPSTLWRRAESIYRGDVRHSNEFTPIMTTTNMSLNASFKFSLQFIVSAFYRSKLKITDISKP